MLSGTHSIEINSIGYCTVVAFSLTDHEHSENQINTHDDDDDDAWQGSLTDTKTLVIIDVVWQYRQETLEFHFKPISNVWIEKARKRL